jgi:hypothetical protein
MGAPDVSSQTPYPHPHLSDAHRQAAPSRSPVANTTVQGPVGVPSAPAPVNPALATTGVSPSFGPAAAPSPQRV